MAFGKLFKSEGEPSQKYELKRAEEIDQGRRDGNDDHACAEAVEEEYGLR